jgi:2-polyprenyl-3-methyl-5-hydroxy-6-metoxy-1,4-benzoquinol methylase
MSQPHPVSELGDAAAIFAERTKCALCGSAKSTVHRNFREIPVLRCTECGFLYSGRVMDAEATRAYYQDNFGSKRHFEGQRVNARTNAAALKRLLDFGKVRSWLDVGTGYGFLLEWLQRAHGIAGEGVELSLQEAEHARGRLGLKIHDSLSGVGVPRARFDVVSCFEVIEHISEPVPFLQALAEYVRPGGALIVMTDNFESRVARKLKGSFPKWIPHSHVSHFGPESLRACLAQVPGLEIEKEASYTPWDLVGREWVSAVRAPTPDDRAFDVHEALSTEMRRNYKLFRLRYYISPFWTRWDLRPSLDGGALMYALARKQE